MNHDGGPGPLLVMPLVVTLILDLPCHQIDR